MKSFHRSKRVRLGQHLLRRRDILEKILEVADISSNDTVFEIGAGDGGLTEELCKRALKVVSYEIDEELYSRAKERLKDYSNLKLILGDAFKDRSRFDILVSNLPYHESSRFIEWLSRRRFQRAIVMVQKEFADKLLARTSSNKYRAISALAQICLDIRVEGFISKDAFRPSPKVSSTLLKIVRRPSRRVLLKERLWLKRLFSFRGRTVSATLKSIAKSDSIDRDLLLRSVSADLVNKRVEELRPEEALTIVRRLLNLKEIKIF